MFLAAFIDLHVQSPRANLGVSADFAITCDSIAAGPASEISGSSIQSLIFSFVCLFFEGPRPVQCVCFYVIHFGCSGRHFQAQCLLSFFHAPYVSHCRCRWHHARLLRFSVCATPRAQATVLGFDAKVCSTGIFLPLRVLLHALPPHRLRAVVPPLFLLHPDDFCKFLRGKGFSQKTCSHAPRWDIPATLHMEGRPKALPRL